MKQTIAIALGVLALTAHATAQEVVPPTPPAGERAAVEARLQLERARIGVESRIIKGAPYSAEAVTETLQVLSDGNRISRKSVSRIYRDSEGRTRRETVGANGDVTTVNISDPVGESQYTLNPETKTAYRNGVIMASGRGGGFATASVPPGSEGTVVATRTPEGYARVEARSAEAERKAETEKAAVAGARSGGGGGRGGAVVAPAGVPPTGTLMRVPSNANVSKEDLGQQVIEGVLAMGSRSTTVIPAGAIGNVQPISVVSEQWFSEDLKILVMTKHSDPRSGETTYRLLNVVQGEPHRSLFEVPPDYTLKDSVIRRQSPLEQ